MAMCARNRPQDDTILRPFLYLLTRPGSIIHSTHEMTATADEKPECIQHCAHFRDEVKMN
ncbi:hypothetical protein D9742_07735 [Escherichia sp. E1V33]|nr:hypothetical protein D9742_07735 [Escherichia sp. E1V33]TBR62780.1 hypothetical protein D9735_19565 [Escherichia sp. E1S7]